MKFTAEKTIDYIKITILEQIEILKWELNQKRLDHNYLKGRLDMCKILILLIEDGGF